MSLRLLVQKAGAEIIGIDFEKDIDQALEEHQPELILINRIFDRDRASGLEVIARLRESENIPPIMLVSNYEDAQKQAVKLGALPGFGKSSLYDGATLDLIKSALSS